MKYFKLISKIAFSTIILLVGFMSLIPFAGELAVVPNIIFFIIYTIVYKKEFSLKSWNTVAVIGLVFTLAGLIANQYFYGINWREFSNL